MFAAHTHTRPSLLAHPTRTPQEPLNLVPKKRNWDLKRDMAPRLARLDRRTQAAVVELLRQRAQEAGSDGDDDEEEEDDEHEPKQEPGGSP